ncbi:MAG: hypothetical protein H6553_02495 [Chitinophagales bacterium]|nr:hypothetical protein [Chitinophagales bacterium]
MLKTILIPDNNQVILKLPDNFIGKKIEIIAFTVEEAKTVNDDTLLTHYASEKSLAKDWLTKEEDKAWELL